jgi:hypothetical protein
MVYYIYIYIYLYYIFIYFNYGHLWTITAWKYIYIYGTHNMKILMEMWSLLCGRYDYSWKYVEM